MICALLPPSRLSPLDSAALESRTCRPLASCARGSHINGFAGMQMQRVRRCQLLPSDGRYWQLFFSAVSWQGQDASSISPVLSCYPIAAIITVTARFQTRRLR